MPKIKPVNTKSAPLQSDLIPQEAFARGPFSPLFHHAAELVGKRWTAAILYSLFHGLNRFTDLVNAIPGVSSRMLTERLKELELEGVIERTVFPETPVRIEYAMTEKGLALRDVFIGLSKWAIQWDQASKD
jgi:DNA-binding HxlR family transcriptional regulator